MNGELQSLHEKLDHLVTQVDALRQRQVALDELLHDMTPAVNGVFQMAVDELDEISPHVQLSDVLALFKRLLRDVHLLNRMLDRLEGVMELAEDLSHLSQPVFMQLTHRLDEMERKGYFAFASEGMYVVDRIVTEFDQEDVHALGDNIVTILRTVRRMTQPEVMGMVNQAMNQMEAPIDEDISLWQLVQKMRDPEVRRGLAHLMHMVKGFAQ